MMMKEDFKKDISNFFKEIQDDTAKEIEAFKEGTPKSFQNLQENITKNMEEFKNTIQDLKMEIEKNKEITKRDNPGDRKPRKEIRSHRCKPHQQNTRDGRENLRCRRYHRKH